MRLGRSIGFATLLLIATTAVMAQPQLPPDPKPIGLPPDPVDIGLPPTPKPIGLPPDPVDIGLPRDPAPMGSSPVAVTVELPAAPKSLTPQGAPGCRLTQLATVKTGTLRDGRIKLPVTIEGRPLSLMVDTGGANTTIKLEKAKEVGLAPTQTALGIVGVAGSMLNTYVASSLFSVGELRIKNLPIYVETRAIADADGTLSPDVLRDFDVDIDFAHDSLSLISQDHCPGRVVYWTTTPSIAVPMNITGFGHVRVPVKIDGRDMMATLDTGAATSFISVRAIPLLGIDPKSPALKLVRDTGQYQIYTYPFQSLELDRVAMKHPPIAIVSDNFAKGLGADLLLGVDFLRHTHLYIAYGEKRLYITAAQAN